MQKLIWYPGDSWGEVSGGLPLFRGFSRPSNNQVIDIQSPSNRLPQNMPLDVQSRMDDWFFKRFGMRFRESSLFATGDITTAQSYAGDRGQIRQLKPKDRFCFCWSPECADLYNEFEYSGRTESVEALLDRLSFQCDELEEALLSHNEIMLVCTAVEATLVTGT
ncbi:MULTISPECIES: hypothetical protein [Pandoraea]|uniref:hypothetical protein n=1 Tax=Pandoraea TaxID=93217 RepID=UPI001F5E08D5|nr:MULTISPECIES: hypothetical protein [Pandoraea]MCI3208806.1 hypothetical protein [Pandoraea sp. LA3]MDN4586835.1 hypothetical protein [Pandoraea capi]